MLKKILDIIPPKKGLQEVASKITSKVAPKVAPAKVTANSRPQKSYYKKVLIMAVVVLLVGGPFVYFSFSGIKIKIWPAKETLSFEEEFVAEVGVNGKLIEVEREKSAQFQATGMIVKDGRASGIIRVYNNYHLAQTLVATTRFLSTEDKLFRSKERVNIPAGEYLDVEVEAAEPGDAYNIGPSTFSVPGLAGSSRYTAVYGKSFSDMKDGFVGEVPQVTNQDLSSAKDNLQKLLTNEVAEVLQLRAGKDYVLLPSSINYDILDSSSLALVGTEIDEFGFDIAMKAQAMVFEKQAVEEFAREYIESRIEENKALLQDSLAIQYDVRAVDIGSGKLTLGLQFSGQIYAEISTASLKQAISGRPLQEVLLFFKDEPQIEKTEIKLWPFWKRKMPSSMEKIEIDLAL